MLGGWNCTLKLQQAILFAILILIVVSVKIMVFWDVMTCSFVDGFQLTGRTCCCHIWSSECLYYPENLCSEAELHSITSWIYYNCLFVLNPTNKSLDGPSPLCIQLQVIIIISKSNTIRVLFISKITCWKTTTCFGLYFLRPSSGRKYPLPRKLYNVFSVLCCDISMLGVYCFFLICCIIFKSDWTILYHFSSICPTAKDRKTDWKCYQCSWVCKDHSIRTFPITCNICKEQS